MTGIRVEAAYDDGATWAAPAEPHVRRDGSVATVLHGPAADAQAVTLRVTEWDRAGSRTQQTVVRVFALRG
ncbi:hypothetical protein OG230_27060 [Streptomyces sp. NBC_00234]|uniref:hypothetical protein n=1 Tax=Streptomyces sp. NBC_00234 TaxID=2903638 RepID=UPI002E2C86FE|nr:hypothetical protein [Streptomyces sp. NBC_00234]